MKETARTGHRLPDLGSNRACPKQLLHSEGGFQHLLIFKCVAGWGVLQCVHECVRKKKGAFCFLDQGLCVCGGGVVVCGGVVVGCSGVWRCVVVCGGVWTRVEVV